MKSVNGGRQKPPFLFGKSMERIKDVIGTYGLWGVFLGVVTVLIKPFISIRQTLRDMVITFLISMLSGLLLEYFNVPTPVKYGVSGVCGLFAVRLYMIADSLLRQVEKDPLDFIKHWKEGRNDR